MRQGKYLNVVLTVNAILLTGLLWTQIAGAPVLVQEAAAQSRTVPYQRVPANTLNGVPNAGKQRDAMIRAINDLKVSTDATRSLLESGNVKVQVTNLSDIRIDVGG